MPETIFFGLHFNRYSYPVLTFVQVIRMDKPAPLHFSVSVASLLISLCLFSSIHLSHNLLLVEYKVIYYQPKSNFQNENVQVGPTLCVD